VAGYAHHRRCFAIGSSPNLAPFILYAHGNSPTDENREIGRGRKERRKEGMKGGKIGKIGKIGYTSPLMTS
jgi:hypothetical protein